GAPARFRRPHRHRHRRRPRGVPPRARPDRFPQPRPAGVAGQPSRMTGRWRQAPGVLIGLVLGLFLEVAVGATQPTARGPDPRSGFVAGDPVDLGTGLYVRSSADIVLPGEPPIWFMRTYVNRDARSRAFGIGGMHSYDSFLVGDSAAFSAIDLVRDDGSQIHFVRTSPGTGLADAVLEHRGTPTEFHRGTLRWNGSGWTIELQNGGRYRFLGCHEAVRPGQCGVIEYRDVRGKMLGITRNPAGDVMSISNADGFGVVFTYDSEHRITSV